LGFVRDALSLGRPRGVGQHPASEVKLAATRQFPSALLAALRSRCSYSLPRCIDGPLRCQTSPSAGALLLSSHGSVALSGRSGHSGAVIGGLLAKRCLLIGCCFSLCREGLLFRSHFRRMRSASFCLRLSCLPLCFFLLLLAFLLNGFLFSFLSSSFLF
jgi:hypothetical protein